MKKLTESKIYILDGAIGTMIMGWNIKESDYDFNDKNYSGCYELLNLTKESLIREIHQKYIDAGADIITTNTFNCGEISLKDFGLEKFSGVITRKGAEIAKSVAEASSRKVFIAGSIGPTNKHGNIEELYNSFYSSAEALVHSEVDFLLVETIYDLSKAEIALAAIHDFLNSVQKDIGIMISLTVQNGCIFSGEDIETVIKALDSRRVISFGINCSAPSEEVIQTVKSFRNYTDKLISFHPNAGLRNLDGEYSQSSFSLYKSVKPLLDSSSINIIGGCCGTTPEYISLLSSRPEID
ncbi:MAG: homocysteine S-methyltransferase family protein [Cetobacterium sp.]